MKMNCKAQVKKNSEQKKVLKKKGDNLYVKWKGYGTKDDIKNITHVDTSSFALKTNLANLKSEVDKLDVDKLKPIPTDLSKLSDIVKNDVVKKTDYNSLVTKVDNIDTSGLVKKIDYNTKITEIEDKISDTSNFSTKTALNTVENKIPDISNLATKIESNKTKNIFIAKQLQKATIYKKLLKTIKLYI